MGIKIQNAIPRSLRVGSIIANDSINFAINSTRILNGLYPAVVDFSSSGTNSFILNMGQNTFVGDNENYAPYDTNFNTSNLVGNFSLDGQDNDIIVPSNLNTVIYNVTKTSGKYYYEVTIQSGGWYGAVGLSPSDGDNFVMLDNGVGVAGIGDARNYLTYSSDVRVTTENGFNTGDDEQYRYGEYDVNTGDVLQVFMDFDNNNITIKRVGTDIGDHTNFITL